jgi:integrase
MKLPRRKFLHLAVGAAALSSISHVARAQAYPSRPVRWIVGYAAGGGNDRRNGRACGRQCLCSAICAARSKGPRGLRSDTDSTGTSELCDVQWSQVELATGRLHVRRAKNGSPSVHPMQGDEIRALRRLQRGTGAVLARLYDRAERADDPHARPGSPTAAAS